MRTITEREFNEWIDAFESERDIAIADAVREAERLARVQESKLTDFCLAKLGQCESTSDDWDRCTFFKGHEELRRWPHQCCKSRAGKDCSYEMRLISWGFESPNSTTSTTTPEKQNEA